MKRAAHILSAVSILLLACSQSPATNSPQEATDSARCNVSDTLVPTLSRPKRAATIAIDPKAANGASDFEAATKALVVAYPDFIEKVENNEVVFVDDSRMTYDDGRIKNFNTMLDDGDVEDMFFVRYDSSVNPPEYLHDAGRSRSEALFKKMYGSSAEAVRKNLVKVNWFGKNVDFTRINGAADSLRKVAAELEHYPELKKYLASSGTFYWRPVRGAKRLSAHSYGIAFDIAVPYSDYWLWKNKGASETARIKYANRFPRKLVEIFERHGFIWGGAWYHFDTMHFEFRPEILQYSLLYGNPVNRQNKL